MTAPSAAADGRLDRHALLGIGAAIGAISAVGTSISLGLPLLGIVLEQRGVSSSAIGISSAMAGVASVVVTPFVPGWAVRVGAARLLAVMVVLATLTFPLFYVFDSYWAWFPLRFVFHGAINGAFILSEFWISALAPPKKRGLILGIYATVLSLGFSVGPVILALVGSEGVTPFVIGTAVLGLSVLPVLAALGADPSMEGGSERGFAKFLLLVPLASFAALTMGATESGVMSFVAIYGLRIGLEERTAALLVTAVAVGNIVSQIPLGMISDRMDRRRLLLIIAAVGAVLSALIPVAASQPWLLAAVLAAWGGVAAGLYTVGLAHLGARLTGADLASANAGFIFMYALGMLAGPAAVGAGMDLWDPHGLAVVSTGFLAAYAVLAAVRIRTVRR